MFPQTKFGKEEKGETGLRVSPVRGRTLNPLHRGRDSSSVRTPSDVFGKSQSRTISLFLYDKSLVLNDIKEVFVVTFRTGIVVPGQYRIWNPNWGHLKGELLTRTHPHSPTLSWTRQGVRPHVGYLNGTGCFCISTSVTLWPGSNLSFFSWNTVE